MRTATEVAVLIVLGVPGGSGFAVAPAGEPICQALAALAALGEIRDMLIKFCAVPADCLQTSLPV